MCKYRNIDADGFVFHWGLHIRMKAKDWHKQKFTKVRFYVTIILPVKRKPKCDHSYMARFCHLRHYKHFQRKWLDSHTWHNFITFVFMTTPMPVFFGEGQRPNYKQITRPVLMQNCSKSEQSLCPVLQWANDTWNLQCSSAQIKRIIRIWLYNTHHCAIWMLKQSFFWLTFPISNKGPVSQTMLSFAPVHFSACNWLEQI